MAGLSANAPRARRIGRIAVLVSTLPLTLLAMSWHGPQATYLPTADQREVEKAFNQAMTLDMTSQVVPTSIASTPLGSPERLAVAERAKEALKTRFSGAPLVKRVERSGDLADLADRWTSAGVSEIAWYRVDARDGIAHVDAHVQVWFSFGKWAPARNGLIESVDLSRNGGVWRVTAEEWRFAPGEGL